MNHFYWDASALGKRYAEEVGTPLANQLFTQATPRRMRALLIGAGEVLSILVRRKNAGTLSQKRYEQAVAQWRSAIIKSSDFRLEPAEDSLIHASFPLLAKHSLNATDAIVLCSAPTIARSLRAGGHDLVLVASDSRLLGAAQAEGLLSFNPETDSESELNALIAVQDAPSHAPDGGEAASA